MQACNEDRMLWQATTAVQYKGHCRRGSSSARTACLLPCSLLCLPCSFLHSLAGLQGAPKGPGARATPWQQQQPALWGACTLWGLCPVSLWHSCSHFSLLGSLLLLPSTRLVSAVLMFLAFGFLFVGFWFFFFFSVALYLHFFSSFF